MSSDDLFRVSPGEPRGALGLRGLRVGRRLDGLRRYVGVLLALALLALLIGTTQAGFLTLANLDNVLQTNAALLIVSVGMTYVVLVGGIDLSVGGVMAFSGVVFALLVGLGLSGGLALAAILLLAPVVGLLTNGMFVAYLRLNFFVVTLATASVFSGLALGISGGSTWPLYDQPVVRFLSTARVGGVTISVLVAGAILLASMAVLNYTGFGRMVYAIGGNAEAARLAGINVHAVRAAAYTICFSCAVVAGLITMGRLQSANPGVGTLIPLVAAAAVLLGGNSFFGGEGGVGGTFLGVLFLGFLSNGLTLAGISGFWQGVVTGVVLLVAVAVDRIRVPGASAAGSGT